MVCIVGSRCVRSSAASLSGSALNIGSPRTISASARLCAIAANALAKSSGRRARAPGCRVLVAAFGEAGDQPEIAAFDPAQFAQAVEQRVDRRLARAARAAADEADQRQLGLRAGGGRLGQPERHAPERQHQQRGPALPCAAIRSAHEGSRAQKSSRGLAIGRSVS
ncbi:MAG TPA: hypothetical protein PLO41_16525 [Rubrivivax sp.]|nr:hypothetical protein [Rubrivivax sp.]